MRWWGRVPCVVLAVLITSGNAPAGAQSCTGDCGGDGQVAITELLTCVNIALGSATQDACAACDANSDGKVTIDELVASVRYALTGCPAATPTATPTETETPTETATALATAGSSATPSPIGSSTASLSPTASLTATPTVTPTVTATVTASPTPSATLAPTATLTLPPTVTPTRSPTRTATVTRTKTPSATPTSPPSCAAIMLDSQSDVSASGSTANGTDHSGGASCGFTGGGTGAPDVVYEYAAPAAGVYDISVEDASFDAYLYVRATSCAPQQPELGCDPGNGAAAPHVALTFAQEQRIAIIADGETAQGGTFTVRVHRRRADLLVQTFMAPETAQAGAQVSVSAHITNQGDEQAGPFTVEFLYARDAALTDPISLTPLVCEVSGLAAGAMTTCAPPNFLSVPLVAAGAYFVGARVDPDGVIDEGDETNNTFAQGATIEAAPGVMLREEVLRAADGTSYQVVTAVATLTRSDTGSFQLTTLGASGALETCATVDGSGAHAAVGAAMVLPLGSIRRTRLLRPSSFAAPNFDLNGSGRLRLGSGAQTVDVCADGSCGGESLAALSSAGGDLPAACTASRADGFCGGGAAATTIGLGIAAAAGQCTDASRPTVLASLCAIAPTDGFRLRPGEQVVLVYDTDRSAFSAGIAGFALAADSQNVHGCPGNRVIDAVQLRDDTPEVPLFRLVQSAISGTATDVAVSADGTFVYVLDNGGALTTFKRIGDASLQRIDAQHEGDLTAQGRVVTGLFGGTRLLLSSDGAQLYAINLDGVAIFQRDVEGGTPAFSGGTARAGFITDGAITPDGQSVYISRLGGNEIDSLLRDPGSGALTAVGNVFTSTGSSALVVSPDSRNLFFGPEVYQRDAQGALEFIQELDAAHAGTVAAVSGDGTFFYSLVTGGIAVYKRGTRTPLGIQDDGTLMFAGTVPDTTPGLAGATALATSPTGSDLYVASPSAGTVAAFRGNAQTDGLDPIGTTTGIAGVSRLVLSQDGSTLAALSGSTETLTLLARDEATGALTPNLTKDVAFEGDDLPNTDVIAVASDGATVYSNEGGLRADRRDPADGSLMPIGTLSGFTPSALAVSPDSQNVYGIAGDALAVFQRGGNESVPVLLETKQDGVDGVDGLAGASAVVVSGDGKHVYVGGAGDAAIAAFSRDTSSGALTFLQAIGSPNPVAMALSPDGADLYVANDASVVLLQRDTSTGLLSSGPSFTDDSLGPIARIVVTGDGKFVYVVNLPPSIAMFQRDAMTGGLEFIDNQFAGVEMNTNLVASPDGAYLFLPGSGVFIYARDPVTGAFSEVDTLEFRFNNSFTGVAVSPDSKSLYFARHVYARAE
jgi:6-phosphogluconolactonase (cycloisomerase 2 family)